MPAGGYAGPRLYRAPDVGPLRADVARSLRASAAADRRRLTGIGWVRALTRHVSRRVFLMGIKARRLCGRMKTNPIFDT
jgi:hypothetical protein